MERRIDISMNVIFRILAIVAGVWFLYVIRDVIALFLVSIIITAALHPIIGWVQKIFRFPRNIAVTTVFILFLVGIGSLVSFIIPTLSTQFEEFIRAVYAFVQDNAFLSANLNAPDFTTTFSGSLGNVLSTTAGVFTGLVSAVAVLSMSFYMSLQDEGLKKSLLMITPAQHEKYIASLINRIQESFGRWMAGQMVTMIFVGILYYSALTLLGVPYAPILALLGGLLEIIPYFGPVMAAVPAIALGFSLSPVTSILIIVAYITINLIENQLLIPKIMNKAIGLNPVLVILALLMGAKVAGVIGLFLAVPVAGALGLFLKDLLERKIT